MSAQIGYSEKTIGIVQFSGKHSDWRMWLKQFLAVSCKKKYKDILLGTTTVPKESETLDESDDTNKAKIKAQEANKSTYGHLILANPHQVAFNILDKAVSADLPNGDARLAWVRLSDKYDSKTSATVVQLSNEFINSKLTDITEDPEEWIVELEILRARLDHMKYPITDLHLMIHVLHNIPEQYYLVVKADEKLLSDANNSLTIKTLKTDLHDKWVRLGLRNRTHEVEGEAFIGPKQFKGRCNNCGKWGHKAADCPDSSDGNGKSNRSARSSGGGNDGSKRAKFGTYGSGF